MTTPATPPTAAPSPDDAPRAAARWARPELEEDLAVLARLRDLVLAMAEALVAEAQAKAQTEPEAKAAPAGAEGSEAPAPAPAPAPASAKGDPALALSRLARAVRMTCALRAKLVGEIDQLDDVQRRRADGRDAQARFERKDQIARLLTGIIHDEAQASEAAETEGETGEAEGVEGIETEIDVRRLVAEANERLNDREIYGDVLARPVSAFIDQVCRDLGLAPDWRRLARQAWAREEIASGHVGAPLLNIPSPSMGEGPRVGVKRRLPKLRRRQASPPDEPGLKVPPEPAVAPQAEPLPPPIPALSPIEGDREAEARSSQRIEPPPLQYLEPRPEPDPEPEPMGLPGELPPVRRTRPYWASG